MFLSLAFVPLVTPLLTAAVHSQPSHEFSKRATSTYILRDTYMGASFLTSFTFETFADGDPTHGRVNYVNETYAIWKGLASVSGTTFTMRADHTTKLSASGPGRDSVRIKSIKQYTTHLAVHVYYQLCLDFR